MPATYARIARRSALTAAVAAVIFAISVFAVGRAAQVSPQAMMVTAMITFIVKILALLVFVAAFGSTTVFNARLFGLTALACVLTWCLAQVVWSMRLKFLYVEPRGDG